MTDTTQAFGLLKFQGSKEPPIKDTRVPIAERTKCLVPMCPLSGSSTVHINTYNFIYYKNGKCWCVNVSIYHWRKGARDHGVMDEVYSGRWGTKRGGVVGGIGVRRPRMGDLRRQMGREGGDGRGTHCLDGRLRDWGSPTPSPTGGKWGTGSRPPGWDLRHTLLCDKRYTQYTVDEKTFLWGIKIDRENFVVNPRHACTASLVCVSVYDFTHATGYKDDTNSFSARRAFSRPGYIFGH